MPRRANLDSPDDCGSQPIRPWMGRDIIYGSCDEHLAWTQLQRKQGWLSSCSPHLLCYPWWPGEAAQRRAASLALSVPQALHDCHDSTCYTALESYRGTSRLWAASPSQQSGPWLQVAGISPHSPGLLHAKHLVPWGLHLSSALQKGSKTLLLGLRKGQGV